ncbi:multinuclear nonheme iron-dependent oxidase [Streptomyces physcomitrii]|uniref:DUF692 domain-containing protein n=1 Tax=Streptomyces physcomitrii TaxID=2724184 RepID=A0ABX1H3I6_9ACTN|nr:DUF692 family multinuclear iron-containing protein [Streptomyces physcomitrii]NKI42927.1 DUF692 domain-containing protein [Streptomyces physcomitrii]
MTTTSEHPAPPHLKPPTIGAGFLYHCSPEFARLYQELVACGGRIDFVEYLATHFGSDVEYVAEVNAGLGNPPSTLHCYEYMIGSVDRPDAATVAKLQRMVEAANCQYIGEHVGMMGTTEQYSGTFLQPFGTDEQTETFIRNLREVKEQAGCALTIENQSQVYNRIGPRSICEQVRDIAVGADVGILLSLSNFIIAERFVPMDREREIAAIPLEYVWQVHLPLGNAAQLNDPDLGLDWRRAEQRWANETLVQLFKEPSFKPVSVVFEIEDAGTPSHATPEELRDALEWARELLGEDTKVEVR